MSRGQKAEPVGYNNNSREGQRGGLGVKGDDNLPAA